jgi:hypothetical protein
MSATPHDPTYESTSDATSDAATDPAPGATPPVTPATPTSFAASHASYAQERPVARGPRPGTVVWGLIVIAVGVMTIVTSTGFSLDLELTAIIGLASAGALLLLTAVIGSARARRR